MCIRDRYLGDEDKFPVYREPTNSPVTTPEYFDAAKVADIDESKLRNMDYPASLQAVSYTHLSFLPTAPRRRI